MFNDITKSEKNIIITAIVYNYSREEQIQIVEGIDNSTITFSIIKKKISKLINIVV